MKKIVLTILGVSFLFCLSIEGSAQKKSKKTVARKKAENTAPSVVKKPVPCEEELPYAVSGSDTKPPKIAKEPCSDVANGMTTSLLITSKPKANYTDAAKDNQVQGTVNLRVVFNANGTIGDISPVNGLPYGLTEQAMAAAKKIRFEPPKKNGKPYATVKILQYHFVLY